MEQTHYQEIKMCPCYRRTLRADEQFNNNTAARILEQSHGRHQAHARASMMEDRFVLRKSKSYGKEPFRSWLGYSEIVDIQSSNRHPEYKVLSVQSANSRNRYYEVYKFKNEGDAQAFERMVREAHANPGHRISCAQPVGHKSINQDTQRSKYLSHIEFETSLDSSDEEYRPSTMHEHLSPTPPSDLDYDEEKSPSPVDRAPSPVVRAAVPAVRASRPEDRTPSPPAYQIKYVQTSPLPSHSPPLKITEPQMIDREPQMIAIEPQMIAREPPMIAREPQITFIEPQIIDREPQITIIEPQIIDSEPVMVKQSVPVARAPEPAPVVTTVEPTREAVVKAPPVPNLSGSEGVTYIKFDSGTQNPSISDKGPVYMYTSRGSDSMNGYGDGTQYQNNDYGRYGGRISCQYAN